MKTLFDKVISILGIILLSPILIIIWLILLISIGSPIIFIQERPGLNEKPFYFFKFRTMTNTKDKNGAYLSDKKRITSFGSFLRRTSLDELPSLWNVIKGDMSLVGPGPLLMEYLRHYSERQKRRHNVKPGITGWAQINGRNKISWEEKFDLDIWYVDNQSFKLDIKILIATAKKVIFQEDINMSENVTMEKFEGNKKL